MTSTTDAVFL